MKFSKAMKPSDLHNRNIYHYQSVTGPCWNCGESCSYMDTVAEAWFCSTECQDKKLELIKQSEESHERRADREI